MDEESESRTVTNQMSNPTIERTENTAEKQLADEIDDTVITSEQQSCSELAPISEKDSNVHDRDSLMAEEHSIKAKSEAKTDQILKNMTQKSSTVKKEASQNY